MSCNCSRSFCGVRGAYSCRTCSCYSRYSAANTCSHCNRSDSYQISGTTGDCNCCGSSRCNRGCSCDRSSISGFCWSFPKKGKNTKRYCQADTSTDKPKTNATCWRASTAHLIETSRFFLFPTNEIECLKKHIIVVKQAASYFRRFIDDDSKTSRVNGKTIDFPLCFINCDVDDTLNWLD